MMKKANLIGYGIKLHKVIYDTFMKNISLGTLLENTMMKGNSHS